MDGSLILLRALAAVLGYPSPELRATLPEIAVIVRDSRLLTGANREALLALVEALSASDPLSAEEAYVDLFDRGRAASLYLFEHVHGEARDRGAAMVELIELYAAAGFELSGRELPDYLPVLLEYLSCRDLAEARGMLKDCAHILRAIGEALTRRGSGYAAVLQTLLSITGEPGIDVEKARRNTPEAEDIDREWAEQPAFAPVQYTGAARP